MDILTRMAARGRMRIWLSVTTLDGALVRRMEPRAATPALLLQMIRALYAPPMTPGLNDMELKQVLRRTRDEGATHAGTVLLCLPHELHGIFTSWLHEHVPDRTQRMLTLIRSIRAGNLTDSQFANRFVGGGPDAAMVGQRFKRIQWELGYIAREQLDMTKFRAPVQAGGRLSLL